MLLSLLSMLILQSTLGNVSLNPFSGSSDPDEEVDLDLTTLILERDLDLDKVLDLVIDLVVDLDLDLVLLTQDFLMDLVLLDPDSGEDLNLLLFRELVLDLV